MPHVRLPWTLQCPRIGARPGALAADVAAQEQHVDDLADRVDAVLLLGQAEAPGDDRAARLGVELRDAADLSPRRRRTGARARPTASRRRARGSPRTPPCARRGTGGRARSGRSGASSTGLATPRRSARSPPMRGCTLSVPVAASRNVAMRRMSCGTIVRRDAASTSGLTWTTFAPRSHASASAVSMRGAFEAAFDADHEDQRRPDPSRRGRTFPCRCRATRSAPGRSPRGTCSSSPAGCSCRARAPTAGRGTSPRC